MKIEKEIRSITNGFDVENRHITGYGILFESESVDMGFIEVIKRGAVTQEQLDSSDIFIYFNHNPEEVLARSINGVGSVKLVVDERGVKYEFDAPNTTKGDELLEHIKRGELFGSSFGFSLPVDGSGERWEKRDGKYYRTITKIERVYELSCVYSPAYSNTTCENRAEDKVNEFEAMLLNLDKQLAEIEETAKY